MNNRITIETFSPELKPDSYLLFILEGTGIPVKEKTCVSQREWVWEYPEIPTKQWDIACSLIFKRIEDLYRKKIIRFGGCELSFMGKFVSR